jgi:hypothetical protein
LAFVFGDLCTARAFFCFPPTPVPVAAPAAAGEEGEGKDGPKISEAYITGGGREVNFAMDEKEGMEGICV